MADENLSSRWNNYRPSKAMWFWSCIACIVATLIVGFTWGGWVTGGSATAMAETAAQNARTRLAASLCVNKFVSSADATAQLAKLKDVSSWKRDSFIEDGGWSKINGIEKDISGVASACASDLMAMDKLPAAGNDAAVTDTAGKS